jgi:signal transduction histidine kinase
MQSSALLHPPAMLAEPRSAPAANLPPAAEAAVVSERSRIARDLHDGPVQAFAGAVFSLHAIKRMLQDNDVESAAGLVAEIYDRLSDGAEELRRIVGNLRPPALDAHGFVDAIRGLCSDLTQGHGVLVDLEAVGCDALPSDTEVLAFRVIQQALANIGAHADAGHVSVRISRVGRRLDIEVADDGIGFDPEQASALQRDGHIGLASMRERAEIHGGTLSIWSRPGAGTRIRLRIPI